MVPEAKPKLFELGMEKPKDMYFDSMWDNKTKKSRNTICLECEAMAS